MDKPKKQRLKQSAKNDAIGVWHSIYRMNCPNAIGYAFNVTDNGKEVSVGEFFTEFQEKRVELEYDFILTVDKSFDPENTFRRTIQ